MSDFELLANFDDVDKVITHVGVIGQTVSQFIEILRVAKNAYIQHLP